MRTSFLKKCICSAASLLISFYFRTCKWSNSFLFKRKKEKKARQANALREIPQGVSVSIIKPNVALPSNRKFLPVVTISATSVTLALRERVN